MSESTDPNTHAVLTLRGDVDVLQTDQLVTQGAAMIRDLDAGRSPVLDLSAVSFIDSSGLSALLRLRRTAQQRGTELRLRRVPERAAVLLRLSGLEQVLPAE